MSESPDDLFRASFTKIERAERHIRELEALAAEYLASEPVTCELQTNQVFAGGLRGFGIKMNFAGVPPMMSATIGDIIHNLRTSLDLLACETWRKRGQREDDVYFPFCDDEKSLEAAIKKRGMDRAGDDVVRLLMELKPYKGGNVALRTIHDLDIQDKHRELLPVPLGAATPCWEIRDEEGNLLRDENGVLAPRIVGEMKPSNVTLHFPAGNALSSQELIPTLHHLVEATARVVEAFKLLFVPSG